MYLHEFVTLVARESTRFDLVFLCKTVSVKLPLFNELYLYCHYKLILRLASVFGLLQKNSAT